MSRGGGVGQEVEHKHRTNTPSKSSYQPPPLSMLWSGSSGALLVVLKVREGIPFLFASVLVFFIAMWMSRSGYTATPRGRCVTPSLLPAMYTCLTVCVWYGVA